MVWEAELNMYGGIGTRRSHRDLVGHKGKKMALSKLGRLLGTSLPPLAAETAKALNLLPNSRIGDRGALEVGHTWQ